jgi:hypothetical protein
VIKLKSILESVGAQRRSGVGDRYRAIVKRGDKFYYVQDDPLGNKIRQEFGPFKTKAAAKKKMQTFPPARNYRDITEAVSKKDIKSIVERVYPQIVKDLGRARKGTPKVEIHSNIYARYSGMADHPGGEGEQAEFVIEENTIYLYSAALKSEEDVIRSLLHEYTHAKQDPKKIKKGREKGYMNDPTEKEARKAENNWKKYL